jgi:chaperonin cofactor prefoldin
MEHEILERIDRLENHFKVYKTDMIDVKDSLKEVRILLGGSSLNNNKGFIMLMESVEKKVDTLEIGLKDLEKDMENTKFWGRSAAGFLFAFLLIVINYFKDKL